MNITQPINTKLIINFKSDTITSDAITSGNIEFSCVVSHDALVNYTKVNYPSSNVDDVALMSELASGYLVQDIFIKLDELLPKLSVIDYICTTEDIDSHGYSFGFVLPIPSLMGNDLTFSCAKSTSLEIIKQKIMSYNIIRPIKLSPISGILESTASKNIYNIKVHEKMLHNVKDDKPNYLKLRLLIDGEVVEVFIHENMVSYLIKQWIDQEGYTFSYNEYFTNIALDILMGQLNKIIHTHAEVLSWSYCRPLAKEYIVMELSHQEFTTNILIPSENNCFLLESLNAYLVKEDITDNEACINNNTKIDFKVIAATASLSMGELNNLNIGDVILCEEPIKEDMFYIDFGNCFLETCPVEGDSVENNKLLRVTGVLAND
jgi:hypothetical protein